VARATAAKNAVLTVLPVSVGGLIYIAYRPESLLLFGWAKAAGLGDAIETTRQLAGYYRPHDLAVECLPAGLWAMSCTAALRLAWSNTSITRTAPLLAVPGLVGVLSEVAQALTFCPGTFDPIDVLFYLAGSALGAMLPQTHGAKR
jgi:hypothetical protein